MAEVWSITREVSCFVLYCLFLFSFMHTTVIGLFCIFVVVEWYYFLCSYSAHVDNVVIIFCDLDISWTIRCCILLRNTILYAQNWQNQHFTYIKQPKVHYCRGVYIYFKFTFYQAFLNVCGSLYMDEIQHMYIDTFGDSIQHKVLM